MHKIKIVKNILFLKSDEFDDIFESSAIYFLTNELKTLTKPPALSIFVFADLDMYDVKYYKKEISPEQQLILDILDEFNVNLGIKSKYIDVIPFFEILSRTISEFEPTPLYNCTSCDVKIN